MEQTSTRPTRTRAAPVTGQRDPARAPTHTPVSAPAHELERAPEHTRQRRRRMHTSNENQDEFYIPLDEIPEGSSYEWKRWTVIGQEDPFYFARMREQGWEPVEPKKHPNWLPPGYALPYIIKSGLILMERPIELTQEARAEMKQQATQQVREAEERLGKTPKDSMTRDHEGARPRVLKEVGRMVTVEE